MKYLERDRAHLCYELHVIFLRELEALNSFVNAAPLSHICHPNVVVEHGDKGRSGLAVFVCHIVCVVRAIVCKANLRFQVLAEYRSYDSYNVTSAPTYGAEKNPTTAIRSLSQRVEKEQLDRLCL